MLSGEKTMQLEPKSQQQSLNPQQLNKEKDVSHERINANKLFPRSGNKVPPKSSNCNQIEAHNLLGSIMTEMKKKN